METFRIYTEGSRTIVRTDHSPLLWLRDNVGKSTRLARWVLRLQDSTFELQHRPGAANRVADALSRNFLQQAEQKHKFSNKALLAAFVAVAGRRHSCWGQARGFLLRGGKGNAMTSPTHGSLLQRRNEVVQKEPQLPGRDSREVEEAGINIIKECQR